eukprot:NODE_203_length_12996_cov_1.033961.p11 type:complete len:135 gc:universal NODE_203_length_12996_cov_1.033961:1745-2149(+)
MIKRHSLCPTVDKIPVTNIIKNDSLKDSFSLNANGIKRRDRLQIRIMSMMYWYHGLIPQCELLLKTMLYTKPLNSGQVITSHIYESIDIDIATATSKSYIMIGTSLNTDLPWILSKIIIPKSKATSSTLKIAAA